MERGIEEHGRVSAIHGRPWHEVPPGSTAPVHWLDSTHDGGPVDRPWERTERDRLRREDREHRERLERMARANIPPPRRDETRFGSLANNSDGDEAFRKDRAVWYERVTGESLDGLPLIEQWVRVDVIARRFRAYSTRTVSRNPRSAVRLRDIVYRAYPIRELTTYKLQVTGEATAL